MKLGREARRQARALYELTLVDGRPARSRLDAIFDAFAEKKPRHYFPVLKELCRLVRLDADSHHAVVESASPLAPGAAQAIETGLRSRFGDITAEFRETPSLVGGLRVRVGCDVWDGSILARLESLKQDL